MITQYSNIISLMKRMNVKIDNNSNTSQKGKVCQHTFNKTEKGTTGYFFL